MIIKNMSSVKLLSGVLTNPRWDFSRLDLLGVTRTEAAPEAHPIVREVAADRAEQSDARHRETTWQVAVWPEVHRWPENDKERKVHHDITSTSNTL